jgi:hypothetical protein
MCSFIEVFYCSNCAFLAEPLNQQRKMIVLLLSLMTKEGKFKQVTLKISVAFSIEGIKLFVEKQMTIKEAIYLGPIYFPDFSTITHFTGVAYFTNFCVMSPKTSRSRGIPHP